MKLQITLALSLVLAGCATMPAQEPLPEDQIGILLNAQQDAAKAFFAQHPTWTMNGRVAVNSPDGGGNGRLEWVQQADGFAASISAPITRQTWRLTQKGAQATLEGLQGGTREGTSADALLMDAARWTVPLQKLEKWMQGIPDARIAVDPRTGRPSTFTDDGWNVRYEEWSEATAELPVLPKRITAEKDKTTRVKLAIDQWSADE